MNHRTLLTAASLLFAFSCNQQNKKTSSLKDAKSIKKEIASDRRWEVTLHAKDCTPDSNSHELVITLSRTSIDSFNMASHRNFILAALKQSGNASQDCITITARDTVANETYFIETIPALVLAAE